MPSGLLHVLQLCAVFKRSRDERGAHRVRGVAARQADRQSAIRPAHCPGQRDAANDPGSSLDGGVSRILEGGMRKRLAGQRVAGFGQRARRRGRRQMAAGHEQGGRERLGVRFFIGVEVAAEGGVLDFECVGALLQFLN
jgi:hypothetical protein